MSDRSGVGAPTQDGAEPERSAGPIDSPSTEAVPRRDGTAEAAPAARRRRGSDLFGAVLGAEPAVPVGTPPGVPDVTRAEPVEDEAPRVATAPATADVAAPAVAPKPAVAPVVTPPTPATDAAPGRPGRGRGGLRARRVHRIVRRVDPWSVLKLSLLFYFCVWLMVVIASVLIWGVAVGSGSIESLEAFIARLLAFETFSFNADQIFRLFAVGGMIVVFLATAISAILAVLFNLISDLIGGIRITVIEEETTRRIVRRP